MVGRLVRAALSGLRMPGRVYMLDTKPIPVCNPLRHGQVRRLREGGASFGKNSVGWFFGFQIHGLMHRYGGMLPVLLTSANVSEKDEEIGLLLASGSKAAWPWRTWDTATRDYDANSKRV